MKGKLFMMNDIENTIIQGQDYNIKNTDYSSATPDQKKTNITNSIASSSQLSQISYGDI